ncbi:uncharacterized protein LOC142339738 [Convolutriloba macropyga]|uniref:uncharacterized protein LOC142339738 n=1 Tax=Convolutriloba macropyga TaxID=536237 RepID=UPI003F521DFD
MPTVTSSFLFLVITTLQISFTNPDDSRWSDALSSVWKLKETFYQQTCSSDVDISMTEVAVHKVANFLGLGHLLHPSLNSIHSEAPFLCSMMGGKPQRESYWDQYLRTELQGVNRNDGVSAEIIMGALRAFTRMCLFDYERVAAHSCELYTTTLELVKLLFVLSAMFTINRIIGKIFQLATPHSEVNDASNGVCPPVNFKNFEGTPRDDGDFYDW